jgi:pimeloyl-ACP methyl ester carboxylesterase
MNEAEIEIASSGQRLVGTACTPSATGRFPAVLMIHGSGPLDRDENMPGQKLYVFNTLAHRLADAGVASVRFDKRGCGKSSGDHYTTGHHDHVGDATAWLDALTRLEFCDPSRVFLLGHSEGCIIAPQVALARSGVAGMILLCPFIEGARSMLMQQAEQIEREIDRSEGAGAVFQRLLMRVFGRPTASQQALLQAVEASPHDVIKKGFTRIAAKWLRELLSLDCRAILARVEQPLLIIAGEKDLQCPPGAAREIAAVVKGPSETHVIPNLTHVLRTEEGTPSLLGSAKLLGRPIDPKVSELVVEWLTRQCR